MNDKYFENDEYWKEHINKDLESDMWIDEYAKYLNDNKGECLDLGCGIGQFSKRLMEYGYNVTSSDISEIALRKVNEFNNNTVKIDMREKLPFLDNTFDLVFANLSIHYFSEEDLRRFLNIFEVNIIEKRETVRFNHKKNYWIFVCKKIVGEVK